MTMACGRPGVTCRNGMRLVIMYEGMIGRLMKVGDYEKFARAALKPLTHLDRWEARSCRTIEAVQSRFSITIYPRGSHN